HRQLVTPIRTMEAAMRRLAGGESDCAIPYLVRRDDIGRLAQWIATFRDAIADRAAAVAARQEATLAADSERRSALMRMAEQIDIETADGARAIADGNAD